MTSLKNIWTIKNNILIFTSGVEAQTMTVWRQADRYEVPRIIYLNKWTKLVHALIPAFNTLRAN